MHIYMYHDTNQGSDWDFAAFLVVVHACIAVYCSSPRVGGRVGTSCLLRFPLRFRISITMIRTR
eukprot:COSAG01_NODE_12989_length_1652_cov_2.582743_1_plen_63_part_01